MIDILAQASETTTGSAQWIGYAVGGLVLAITGALGGAEAHHRASKRTRETRDVCPVHDKLEQQLAERKENTAEKIAEVKVSVEKLEKKVDYNFGRVFQRMDALHGLVKNGQSKE